MNDQAIYLIVFAVAIFLLFTVGRILILWFFKIDKHIENQERIIKRLDEVIKNTALKAEVKSHIREENGTLPKLTV